VSRQPGSPVIRWKEMKPAILSLSFIFLVGLATVEAPAFLDHAAPAVGSKVKQLPHAVSVWFTEPLQPALSTIKVLGATHKQIDEKDTHVGLRNQALVGV